MVALIDSGEKTGVGSPGELSRRLTRKLDEPLLGAQSQAGSVHAVLIESGVQDVVGLGLLVAALPTFGRTRREVSDEPP